MTVAKRNAEIVRIAAIRGIRLTADEANTLRRAALTLQSWGEGECGDSNDYASWAIERDETGLPYRVVYPRRGAVSRTRIPDREAGALRRVARICADRGIYYHHQTDPRGAPLYVAAHPIDDQNYPQGIAV